MIVNMVYSHADSLTMLMLGGVFWNERGRDLAWGGGGRGGGNALEGGSLTRRGSAQMRYSIVRWSDCLSIVKVMKREYLCVP